MMQETRYRDKREFRSRGHADLARRAGGVMADVDERLARQPTVRLLELGCGYGTVLLELRQRYGARVELCGVNRRNRDGDLDAMRRNGMERGLYAGDADGAGLPALVYTDVAHGLPFAEETFDIVFSQVAWLYFGNKVGVLREVSRVLRPDGLARIDADEVRHDLPPEYNRLVEIWQAGKLIPFGVYAHAHGMSLVPAADGEYLRFGKCPRFGADLETIVEIDVSAIDPTWSGVKCVYRRRDTAPDAPQSGAL
jgi:SAM-dependent methyltransferase